MMLNISLCCYHFYILIGELPIQIFDFVFIWIKLWIECFYYSKIHNPHCYGIWRYGLWEVNSFTWGPDSETLILSLTSL